MLRNNVARGYPSFLEDLITGNRVCCLAGQGFAGILDYVCSFNPVLVTLDTTNIAQENSSTAVSAEKAPT